MPSVLDQVLEKIKPGKKEQQQMQAASRAFLVELQKNLKGAKAILSGSGAKETWIAGNYDVDIFVQYDYKQFSPETIHLSDLLEKSLKKTFPKQKLARLHGSRDYFQIPYAGLSFEVVPILCITKAAQAKNITDVSPLHAVWVKKNVKNTDEVLLAKQFCKAQSLYGAESFIRGFSGYVLEILLAKYKTFEGLLRASLAWKDKEVIDLSSWYKKKEALFHLNQSKLHSPIIVIDPVDKFRNAAAALSYGKLKLFRQKAKEYLQHPDESFFFPQQKGKEEWQKEAQQKKLHLVMLEVKPLSGKRDVVGAKLLKSFEFVKKKLAPFEVKSAEWQWDTMIFLVGKKEIASAEERKGPPLEMKEAVEHFKKKHKVTMVKDGRVVAVVAVKNPALRDAVKAALKEKYVKEKVAGAKVG